MCLFPVRWFTPFADNISSELLRNWNFGKTFEKKLEQPNMYESSSLTINWTYFMFVNKYSVTSLSL